MIIQETLENFPSLTHPIALTIGTFDGMHLGHQYLLTELKKHGTPVVLTFSNHPLAILNPLQTPSPIISTEEKLELLRKLDIQMTVILPFSQKLAQIPYDRFLYDLHAALPFSTLVLGENARLGNRAEGDPIKIQAISKIIGFKSIFLPNLSLNGEVVSSRQIRHLIKNRQFEQAEKLLGHSKFKMGINS